MSSVLIVESKNDKCFVEALIKHLNLQNIKLDNPICQIDDYECLAGLDQQKLINALTLLRNKLPVYDIQAIGIILDDDGQRAERIELINKAVKKVFATAERFSNTGELITIPIAVDDGDNLNLRLACFLTNVEGQGELETVLKAIKTKPSLYADCLDNWRQCLADNGKTITDKDFDKFWLNNYIRFDTCSNKEQKQAGRKCSMQNFEYVMEHKADIWDFDHPVLDDFKDFLTLFGDLSA